MIDRIVNSKVFTYILIVGFTILVCMEAYRTLKDKKLIK